MLMGWWPGEPANESQAQERGGLRVHIQGGLAEQVSKQ